MSEKFHQLSHKKQTAVELKVIIPLSDQNLLIIQEWPNVLEDDWSHVQEIYFSLDLRLFPSEFQSDKAL